MSARVARLTFACFQLGLSAHGACYWTISWRYAADSEYLRGGDPIWYCTWPLGPLIPQPKLTVVLVDSPR